MRLIRYGFITLCLLVGVVNPAAARVDIDLNLSLFPELVPVPGYPVYYAPSIHSNYFFYDGMYWVFEDDGWYVSEWYNGPWDYVDPEYVPIFVLRIPVRYYRRPPPYFHGWRYDDPPRWGDRWGEGWERHHRGWDHWDRHQVPQRAPLPSYQHSYSGDRYPGRDEQREVRERNYHYQPRDSDVRHRDMPERVREPSQPERRDDSQRQRSFDEDRQPPKAHDDRNSYVPSRNRDAGRNIDADRSPRNQHEFKDRQPDNRPTNNEAHDQRRLRENGHGPERGNDNNRGDRPDKENDKR